MFKSLSQRLREMLGSESAGHWMAFMEAVETELPLLSAPGAPSKAAIKASPIGEAGFSSWREMVENGLGWNMHSWRAWRRAWNQVKAHPYLRDTGLTASEINTIARDTVTFPSSLGELEAYRSERKEKADDKRQNSVSTLQKQLDRALADAEALRAEKAAQAAQLHDLQRELADANVKIGRYDARISAFAEMGFMARLRFAIGL